jgi:hypothetical protein
MLRLANESDLNLKMGQAAYHSGALQNTWQDYAERLLKEYSRRIQESFS